jgi:predicted RNA-binding Zn-ribbon protein involved in translation (DUF1610 family)
MSWCIACNTEVSFGRFQGLGFPCPKCGAYEVRSRKPAWLSDVIIVHKCAETGALTIFGPFADEKGAEAWIDAKGLGRCFYYYYFGESSMKRIDAVIKAQLETNDLKVALLNLEEQTLADGEQAALNILGKMLDANVNELRFTSTFRVDVAYWNHRDKTPVKETFECHDIIIRVHEGRLKVLCNGRETQGLPRACILAELMLDDE